MEDLIDKLIPNGNFYSLNAARIVVQAAGLRYDVQKKLIDYLYNTNRHSYLDASKVKIIKNTLWLSIRYFFISLLFRAKLL